MQESELKKLAEQALRHLSSDEGKKELREAGDKSREATEPFRRARDIDPDHLNQRFTV